MKTVMVVDDEPSIVEVCKIILETEGYNVITAATGKSIYAGTVKADLYILDILLSGEDGRHICIHLKSHKKTKNIPVILFSAHSSGTITQEFPGCTPDFFLAKPFDMDEMLSVVARLLQKN